MSAEGPRGPILLFSNHTCWMCGAGPDLGSVPSFRFCQSEHCLVTEPDQRLQSVLAQATGVPHLHRTCQVCGFAWVCQIRQPGDTHPVARSAEERAAAAAGQDLGVALRSAAAALNTAALALRSAGAAREASAAHVASLAALDRLPPEQRQP